MEKVLDILKRALKTFLQGFIGALPVTISYGELTDEAFMKALFIGALAGGISALMNAILTALKKNL